MAKPKEKNIAPKTFNSPPRFTWHRDQFYGCHLRTVILQVIVGKQTSAENKGGEWQAGVATGFGVGVWVAGWVVGSWNLA